MKCDNCGNNDAEFHIPSADGKFMHLCKDCAGMENELESNELDMSVHDLFGGIMNLNEKSVQNENAVCNSCGLTFDNFRDIGRLGCANCYNDFREQLEPILRKLHGTTKHRGKRPAYLREAEIDEEIKKLKRQLKIAIKKEEYEKAAKIRDRLKSVSGAEK